MQPAVRQRPKLGRRSRIAHGVRRMPAGTATILLGLCATADGLDRATGSRDSRAGMRHRLAPSAGGAVARIAAFDAMARENVTDRAEGAVGIHSAFDASD